MKKFKILKNFINYIKIEEVLTQVQYYLDNEKKKSFYITVNAVHGLVESYFNKEIRDAINNSDLAIPDGRPIYWTLKLLGKQTDHIPGYFLTDELIKLSLKKNLNFGILGSTNKIQIDFINELKKINKDLNFSYKYSPPFRKLETQEEQKIKKDIEDSKIDILFVALGAPKQELWMYKNNDLHCVMIGIGAAVDFISKNKKKPPQFLINLGLGWLFRLVHEPRRLFLRYFFTNSFYILMVFIQLTKIKFYNLLGIKI